MKKYNILIVDDENSAHVMLKAILHDEYNLYFAANAQQAINLLADTDINLILLDIHMPQITGIELLESLMIDSALRFIPVIIITGKAVDEFEVKADELGAASIITKEAIYSNKELLLENVRNTLSPNSKKTESFNENIENLKGIFKQLLVDSVKGDMISSSRKLGVGLIHTFKLNYYSFWTLSKGRPILIMSMGDKQPVEFGSKQMIQEPAYKKLITQKKPYLTNNPSSSHKGFIPHVSKKMGLNSEIAIPVYQITKERLIRNKMKIPADTEIFGFIIMKRNRVFTTKEFNTLSTFIIQSGTILYQQYLKY